MTEQGWVPIAPNARHMFHLGFQPAAGRVRFETRGGDDNGVLVASFQRGNRDGVVGGPGVSPSAFEWDFGPGEVVTARVVNLSHETKFVRAVIVPVAAPDAAARLRQRLNDHNADIEELAADAEMLFADAGATTLVRWLQLERGGYAGIGRTSALHEALGLPAGDRLVVHVLAYRVQRGQIVEGTEWTGRPFQHFFVESLHDLVQAADRARRGHGAPLRLDFGPPAAVNYPVGAIFPVDVFERIVLGFRATLHLQLGSLRT